MADAVVSFLLEQLSTFLREETTLLGGFRDDVQLIKDDLGQMKGVLTRAEAIVETNPELEAWISQLRDVAYDAEDVLDEFTLRFGRQYGDGFLGHVHKVCSSTKNLKSRHQLATKLHTIKDRIVNISKAYKRYHVQPGKFELGSNLVDKVTFHDTQRNDAFFVEEADLVGIERPKKKLMNMLFSRDSQVRVISVVGMGGLGKTTLVKKVYDDAVVKNHFKHHVWITVSQSFKIETLLIQVIRQLFKELNQPVQEDLETMDINSMKQLIRDLLHQENYILVFDDVWRTTDWDIIRIALPRNDCGGRIIVTTRITKVSQAASIDSPGFVYPLEPLSKEISWNLFCQKAFRVTSCPKHLEQIARTIIERCAGLPLAIVVIGSVMATKSLRIEEWDLFNRSLSEQIAGDDQLEKMTNLLSFSYYNLPHHLRICFLYLSILPEDVFIEKKRLIRLWIAEGFVQKKEGMTIEEVAEWYLHELVNRSLVQVAETTVDGRVKTCRVHDIIHQIILRKAREQGITTIFRQGMQFSNKVRRLVIHNSVENTQVSNELLKGLRSIVLFGSIDSMFESSLLKLSCNGLKLLKVLDLRGASLEVIPNEIFKLFHLKYLSLRNTMVKTVPKLIGDLQKLETLDLKHTRVTNLPIEILKLQQLRHLLVRTHHAGFQFPYRIGNLQSLQSLCYIDAVQMGDVKVVTEIGKLTQLRRLVITNLKREDGEELCHSLEKLTNLRSLRIFSINDNEVLDLQYSLSSTPRFLHTIKLRGRLERTPQWMTSLQGLTRIYLYWSRLRDDPLELLQDLPNLVELVLWQAYKGEELCFKAGGFQGLKILHIWGLPELKRLRIEHGAMPLLKKLVMKNCKLVEDLPKGIEHLKNLQLLQFADMSERFVKMLENMDKKSMEYKKIAHINQRIVTYSVGGDYKHRYL